ncbi:MAG TPA: CPBP family intramembrane glutamic endopeptidase [Solirubrobacterales bacterium]|nr:CPBP family intramembrane glutamic endopeptidase [Solirubrobacterales bacterium]
MNDVPSSETAPTPYSQPAATGPPPEEPTPAWGPRRVLGGLAVLLALVVVEAGIVSAFDPDIESLAATLVLQAALAATLVGVAFAVARPGGGVAAPAELGLRRPLHPAIKASAIAYFAYIGCALVIAALIQPEQEDVTRDLGADEGVLGSIAAGLLIIGAAPITEEIFFRGFMFAGLRRGTPFAVAALVSAGIWGVFHYTGADTWGVVLQLTVFGVALAWLYERTGSLWPPIAVHALNNALAFAILMSS